MSSDHRSRITTMKSSRSTLSAREPLKASHDIGTAKHHSSSKRTDSPVAYPAAGSSPNAVVPHSSNVSHSYFDKTDKIKSEKEKICNENIVLRQKVEDLERERNRLSESITYGKSDLVEQLQNKNKKLQRELDDTKYELNITKATLSSLQDVHNQRGNKARSGANGLTPFSEHVSQLTLHLHECLKGMGMLQTIYHTNIESSLQRAKSEQQEKLLQYEDQLNSKSHETEKYRRAFIESNLKVNDLSSRLASEMGSKVAANESAIENVSIKIRPTTVASEYSNFCSQQWLDAKTALDSIYRNKSDSHKLDFLCTVLLIAENMSKAKHAEIREEIKTRLLHPLHKPDKIRDTDDISPATRPHTTQGRSKSLSRQAVRSRHQTDTIALPVTNVIGDFLRTTSETTDLSPLITEINSVLIEKYKKAFRKELQPNSTIQEYIQSSAEITWKMVNQRPQMSFSTYGIGLKFCEYNQEVAWGSDNPEHGIVDCYAYPALYHDKTVMFKGKVLIKWPTTKHSANFRSTYSTNIY